MKIDSEATEPEKITLGKTRFNEEEIESHRPIRTLVSLESPDVEQRVLVIQQLAVADGPLKVRPIPECLPVENGHCGTEIREVKEALLQNSFEIPEQVGIWGIAGQVGISGFRGHIPLSFLSSPAVPPPPTK